MNQRTPIRRISSKRLAQRGGKVFSTIQKRGKPPAKRETPRAVHSERTAHITGHKRIRLHGKAREQRRAEIFERSGGRCEEILGFYAIFNDKPPVYVGKGRCPNRATQWSHTKHAANKCDCYSPTAKGACSIASCDDCHDRRHHPKACPKKPISSMEE